MDEKEKNPFENWGDRERGAMVRSEIAGGAKLDELPIGAALEIETQNSIYLLEHRSDGFYLSGNQKYCPQPIKVEGLGSNFSGRSGNLFKPHFIGREMFMEFHIPGGERIVTSLVKEIREVSLPDKNQESKG